ncbi:MAG: hypothetical protein ABII01_04405 [Candidatus Woesearchaeota archaeon]
MESKFKIIQDRNRRVEADKAWETSFTRRGIIAIITYFIAVWFLWTIGNNKPWLNALVPTIGFILSTLSLPFIKKWWVKNIYKR